MLELFGIPTEFFIFGLTLVGIAVLHRHALPIALGGLAAIVAFKLGYTGTKRSQRRAQLHQVARPGGTQRHARENAPTSCSSPCRSTVRLLAINVSMA